MLGRGLVLAMVFVLMSLPLVTTFNEILTRVAEKSGAYVFLARYVVPVETKAVSLVMRSIGIKTMPTPEHLYFRLKDGRYKPVFFSWNCLGWQSGILLLVTLAVGLSGRHDAKRRLMVVALGLAGTFWVNILRISAVSMVAYLWNEPATRIAHDYLGSIFTIGWFWVFWWFSYKFILV